jgi:hypothetical protein
MLIVIPDDLVQAALAINSLSWTTSPVNTINRKPFTEYVP